MGRKKKLNFSEMITANGKIWDGNEINFVHPKYHSFGSTNINDYESKLRGLDKIDLNKHATDVCVMPRENKESLIKELLREFSAAHK